MKRISNSFTKAELEVVKNALLRPASSLLGGLEEEEHKAITLVIQKALCGADIRQLVRSQPFRDAMSKLAAPAKGEQNQQPHDGRAFGSVWDKITKMLEKAEQLEAVEAVEKVQSKGGEDGLEERGA